MPGIRDIFISYRREDSAGHAGRLFDYLKYRLGNRQMFMDMGRIDPGVDFHSAITEALARCGALIVMIGPRWLAARDERGTRLDQPNDWVRVEIEIALKRRLRVIPVLIGGARPLTPEQLPSSLAPLARLQAIELHDSSWDTDVDRLLRLLNVSVSSRAALRIAIGVALAAITITVTLALWESGPKSTGSGGEEAGPGVLLKLDGLTPEKLESIARNYYGLNPLILRNFLPILQKKKIAPGQFDAALKQLSTKLASRRDYYTTMGHASDYGLPGTDLAKKAEAALQEGRFEDAKTLYEEAAKKDTEAKKGGSVAHAAYCLWNVGQIDDMLLEPEQAMKRFSDASRLAVASGNPYLQILIPESWAQVARAKGDYAQAVAQLKQAVNVAERMKDHWSLAAVLIQLAQAYEAQGNYQEAVPIRARAFKSYEATTNASNSQARENAQAYADALQKTGKLPAHPTG